MADVASCYQNSSIYEDEKVQSIGAYARLRRKFTVELEQQIEI